MGKNRTYLYLIRAGIIFYKVGISQNVAGRLASIRTDCPLEAELEMSIGPLKRSVARRLERSVLRVMATYRLRGEWLEIEDWHLVAALKECMEIWGKWGNTKIVKLEFDARAASSAWKTLTDTLSSCVLP